MRKPYVVLLASLVWMAVTTGATEPIAKEAEPPPAAETSKHPLLPAQANIAGTVMQTMDVSQYTYLEIDTGAGLVWVCRHSLDQPGAEAVRSQSPAQRFAYDLQGDSHDVPPFGFPYTMD